VQLETVRARDRARRQRGAGCVCWLQRDDGASAHTSLTLHSPHRLLFCSSLAASCGRSLASCARLSPCLLLFE